MNGLGGEGGRLWDEEDGFYYDFVRRRTARGCR